jgi:SOS-response transcriptional repressor LexA
MHVSAVSAAKFSKAIGYSEATVSNLINNSARPTSEKLITACAKELKISTDKLLSCFYTSPAADRGGNYSPLQEVSLTYVPVVGTVSAETFNCVFEEDDITPMEVLPVPMTRGTKAKALKVRGDCMEPAASDGDYVVVAAKAAYEDGSLIVAKVDGECTLKRVYLRGKKALLIPDNKEYKKLEVNAKDLVIVGVVIYTIRKQAPKKL